MKTSLRISGALAASLALTGTACADGPTTPTSAEAHIAANRTALSASARVIGDESARLMETIRDTERRSRLALSIERLSLALDAGNSAAARRALADARVNLVAIDSDADRDALRLALDATEESLGKDAK